MSGILHKLAVDIGRSAIRSQKNVEVGMTFYQHFITIVVLTGTAKSHHCPGFRQSVDIPQGYVKHVPDALFAGNATEVKVEFRVRQLRRVIERR